MNREERIYSVTMTEEELRLFSEFLGQKSFDNKDYEKAEGILRRASRGELSDPDRESYIGAASEYLAEGDTRAAAAQKAINEGRDNPTQENFDRAVKFVTNYGKHVEDSDQIIDAKKKSIIDLNNLSKEKNRRMNEILSEDPNKSEEKYNPKTDKPLVEIDEDVPIITEPGEEDKDTLALADRVRHDEEQKKNLIGDNKKSDGRSLGKDAAIAAGAIAVLGAGAYGLHKYLKKKKAEKELAENKYKTSDKKKKK